VETPRSTFLVYDDRRRARELLGRMCAAVPGGHQVIAVGTAEELILRLTGTPGQVAVVGTRRATATGTDAIRRVLTLRPAASVVAVGSCDDAGSVRAAVAAGARGFLPWDASPGLTKTVLQTVAVRPAPPSGILTVIDPVRPRPVPHRDVHSSVPTSAVARWLSDVAVQADVQVRLGISRREIQVLGGISQGLSNTEIGRELYLSDNTVKSHARRLFGKLGVHERAHAVACAYRVGLFAPPDGARLPESVLPIR
jgi:DNA-binding NarL/FixJ family response regulator